MGAPEATERALKRGGAEASIEEDAQKLAKIVIRYWGVHAKDVLKRAAELAEQSE